MRAAGIDHFSERSNEYSYRSVREQYSLLLDRLALPEHTKVVDAGAGIGFYTELLHRRGFDVTAVDISEDALAGIDGLPVEKVCSPLRDAVFAPGAFDVVHSFDVVYHIISDREWEGTLQAFCTWSKRFIILHERFLRAPQLAPSRIMKMRTHGQTSRVLRAHVLTVATIRRKRCIAMASSREVATSGAVSYAIEDREMDEGPGVEPGAFVSRVDADRAKVPESGRAGKFSECGR